MQMRACVGDQTGPERRKETAETSGQLLMKSQMQINFTLKMDVVTSKAHGDHESFQCLLHLQKNPVQVFLGPLSERNSVQAVLGEHQGIQYNGLVLLRMSLLRYWTSKDMDQSP